MLIASLVFAALGVFGGLFLAIKFALNRREIDKKAVADAERILAIKYKKSARKRSPTVR